MKDAIYVSMTPNMTNEEFEVAASSGANQKHPVPYRRLYNQSINEAVKVKPDQRIQGLVMTEKYITVVLVTQ